MNDAKPVWKSKTIWFNVLALLATGLTNAADFFPPHYALAIAAIGNLILRYTTTTPVEMKL